MIRETAVFVLLSSDFVLMEKRHRSDYYFPDLWVFPGGKLQKNETPESALLREMAEELGPQLNVKSYQPLFESPILSYVHLGEEPYKLHPYLVQAWEGMLPITIVDSGTPLRWRHIQDAFNSPLASVITIAGAVGAYLARQR